MKPFICGNWKCNFTVQQAEAQMRELADLYVQNEQLLKNVDLAIAPPAPLLYLFQKTLASTSCLLAMQNIFYKSGAYTGEWTGQQVQGLGVRYAIVGHSERRLYFGETDEAVAQKCKTSLESDLIPIVCIGESLKQYTQGLAKETIAKQIQVIAESLSPQERSQIIFAYEPVWAIGSGKTPQSKDIIAIHSFIKDQFSADNMVLYGGSVNAQNAKDLFCAPYVNGFLVGNASLMASSLVQIALACI